MSKECYIANCSQRPRAKGLCSKHYDNLRRRGDPLQYPKKKHGMHNTPEYRVWKDMKSRCSNKNHHAYERYGGRGVFVCKEWNDFAVFIRDMGRRPSDDLSLDRIDNDKGYSKENCRWATRMQQQRNMRTTVMVEYGGDKISLQDLADITGINIYTLRSRHKNGLSGADLIKRPVYNRKNR